VSVDRQTFFDIMAAFPSGVAIVTTLDAAGEPRGLTTTAVASVSADPPLLLVCVDLGSRTLPALRERGRFIANFIREGRSELCLRFASKQEEKFAGVAWRATPGGLPLLHEDALAWAECAVEQEHQFGDHVVFFGRVEAGRGASGEDLPLMYYRRSWGVWSPAQTEETPEPVAVQEVSGRELRWEGAEI
jgi:flavin reductase (DIM6/NTAB) family NADH-FMN oxidoreductase RutF